MNITLPRSVHQAGYLMVLVTGGRFFAEEFPVFDALDQIAALCDRLRPVLEMVIVQGGAPGADKFARTWAWHNNVQCITERARWELFGKAAGPTRNQAMIDKHQPDLCLALPGGNGTADMVRRCTAAGIPVFTYDGASDP